jgi:hypothetical protein
LKKGVVKPRRTGRTTRKGKPVSESGNCLRQYEYVEMPALQLSPSLLEKEKEEKAG